MVEQALTSLQREYELEKRQYEQLSGKHQAAIVAENLERKQGGERFSVLYSAYRPTDPISPVASRLLLMALALGLSLGIALVVGREYLDRSVHDTEALRSEFAVPVLGEIPHIDRAA